MFPPLTRIPPGRWAVGVSGGADSIALLAMLRDQMTAAGDLHLHVVHLDHQTRGDESTADAAFVADLAARWQLPCTVATLDRVEAELPTPNANPSARYRDGRLALFRTVTQRENLQAVILAHHATDQAETIFQRVLRGGTFIGVHGMAADKVVAGVRLLRPLLSVASADLRQWLTQRGIDWREDASNQSPKYQRNRVRRLLSAFPALAADALSRFGAACRELGDWVDSHAPPLAEQFATAQLHNVPHVLASHAVRRWLAARVPPCQTSVRRPSPVSSLWLVTPPPRHDNISLADFSSAGDAA